MFRSHRNLRRGNYAALFGVSSIMLLGFTAIGVDTGWQRLAMTQLHNAADAGAHAGAMKLDGTVEGIENAVERAYLVTVANSVHGSAVPLDSNLTVSATGFPANSDIIVGRFDSPGENTCGNDAGCWTVIGGSPSSTDYTQVPTTVDASSVNAVRVNAVENVNTFFASFPFGQPTIGAANYAVARLPIYEGVGCAFPLAIPECSISELMGGSPCGKLIRWRFSNSNVDTAAYATPVGQTGANVMKEMVASAESSCTSAQADVEIGDNVADIDLNNGNVTSVTDVLVTQLAGGSYSSDFDGDGTIQADETFDYSGLPNSWDTNWGTCPATLADGCDTTLQGICKCNGQEDCSEYGTQSGCENPSSGNGGTWTTTCPDAGPECPGDGVDNDGDGDTDETDSKFIRRQAMTFDSSGDMGCDGTNGNLDTANQSWNFNDDQDGSGYVTVVIYNAQDTANDKFLDVFITCNDESGNAYPADDDGNGTDPNGPAVHEANETVVEPPENGTVSIVE